METACYTNMLSKCGEKIVQASIIHTAPGCKSMIDSDNEEDIELQLHRNLSCSSRNSGREEEWQAAGSSSWRNAQLGISINSTTSPMDVIYYTMF